MKKFIMLLIVALSLAACTTTNQIEPKQCSYCNTHIFWNQTDMGVFQTKWECAYQSEDEKLYHPWCFKIIKNR